MSAARSQGRAGRRRRGRRRAVWAAAVLALFALLFYGGGGWFFSNLLFDRALDPDRGTGSFEIEVLGYDGDTVILAAGEDAHHAVALAGVWGLESPAGYGQVGAITSSSADRVVRSYTHITGAEPAPGALVRLELKAFPQDPLVGLGIPFDEITVDTELGPFPAWLVEGSGDTWVICLHGNGLTRLDCLRMLGITAAAGYPTLVITYRNHPQAVPDPSGIMHYGHTEWPDLEDAVQYLVDRGAHSIVLAGYSMGGAVTTAFLLESDLAGEIDGVILDAPAIDFGTAVAAGAEEESLPLVGLPVPDSLVTVTKWITRLRWGLDFPAIDYLGRVDELRTPILLFHGNDDGTVPVEISDELADRRPDLVWEYHRGANADHIETWNVDPTAYEDAVLRFLMHVSG